MKTNAATKGTGLELITTAKPMATLNAKDRRGNRWTLCPCGAWVRTISAGIHRDH